MASINTLCESSRKQGTWNGGKKVKRPSIARGECTWYTDCLSEQPTCRPWHFRKRFRVPLKLFRRLLHDLPLVAPDLQQKFNAVGRPGATSWQKIIVSLRRLGDGSSYQSLDD